MFPGDPGVNDTDCKYWSECNSDDAGTDIEAADRRFVMGTGPFTINPGDFQQIVYGLIWAQGTDNYDSVQKLKNASSLAQAAYDIDFVLPSPPAGPEVTVTPIDEGVILEWSNSPESNNFLESYQVNDPFAPTDNDIVAFEGYEIIQYDNPLDQIGNVVAVYDLVNGITQVVDGPQLILDGLLQAPQTIVANGTDSGIKNYHVISGLTNYTTYYFGVQAYAQNYDNPGRKISRGPITRVEVVPTKSTEDIPDIAITASESTSSPDFVATVDGVGDGFVHVDVINPAAVKEADYTVEFYERVIPGKRPDNSVIRENENELDPLDTVSRHSKIADSQDDMTVITYDVKRDGTVIFDGSSIDYAAPQRDDVMVLDGLEFTIRGPEPGYKNFLVTANASGPLDSPAFAAITWSNFPNPDALSLDRDVQQTNGSIWMINAGGAANNNFATFVSRSTRDGGNLPRLGINDYEIRFTEYCMNQIDGSITLEDCLGYRGFVTPASLIEVPFELWDTGVSTPDDQSDDVRLIAVICDTASCNGGLEHGVFDIGNDHVASGAANDPFTDWIYFYRPSDTTPGQIGRDRFYRQDPDVTISEAMARIVLVGWNIGTAPPYDPPLPEPGTVFRILTNKPNQSGAVFSFSTKGYAPGEFSDAEKENRLEDIGIVPNPYKGASSYEVSQLTDEVRFTNLPDVATIRVFTLNGTLIKTINKQSPGVATIPWNLTTDDNLPIASGLYLINVEVPDVGSHTIKFAVVKKRIQLNVY